ncbi:MAG: hypothetical protein LBE17_10710 [Treponema sp.]|jgi:hypothetical protein|nr:hypothetical protein [Treponema sp.]
MRKVAILLFAFTFGCAFTSCYSIPNVRGKNRFSPEEKNGYLLMRVITPEDPSGLIFRITKIRRFPPGIAEWHNLKAGENFIFIKAPPGEYAVNYVFDRSFKRVFTDFELKDFDLSDWLFTLESGVIAYLGDLVVVELAESVNVYGNRIVDFKYTWQDNYDGVVSYVRDRYGGIPEDMPFVNQSLQAPADTRYEPIITGGL